MHIVVYGGAFDPLHNGHQAILQHITQVPDIDRVCVVPTGVPVYKKATFFPGHIRHAMLESICNGIKGTPVDIIDYEYRREVPSYTVDTIHYLKDRYQAKHISLVVGFDQLYQFHRWRNYQTLLALCNLWVFPRDGMNQERLMASFPDVLKPYQEQFKFQSLVPPRVSSTQVRIRIDNKKPIHDFVPKEVQQVIDGYLTF